MLSWNDSKPDFVLGGLRRGIAAMMVVLIAASADAQDWENVEFIQHSVCQAVNSNGTGAYSGEFPLKLRGVVLNNTEDWLDPTAAYSVVPWDLGGQAEFYVQAVDLAGDTWDDGDFGGTACWMGQNCGNLGFVGDVDFNYSNDEWYAELDRLRIWWPDSSTSPLVRAGSLVEVRARGGLNYNGKMNVNEEHSDYASKDFEIVILDPYYGLPTPTSITLADVKDAADDPIFDFTRATGGELYQSTLVEIKNMRFVDASIWGTDSDLVLTDGAGRTLDIHLGLNDSFDTQPAFDLFNVVGIMDQNEYGGTGGYRLLAMNAADFELVPEPGTLALLASGALMLLIGGYRSRRRKV